MSTFWTFLKTAPKVLGVSYSVLAVTAAISQSSILTTSLLLFSAAIPPLVLYSKTFHSFFWLLNTFGQWIKPVQFSALDFILKNSAVGNPQSVIDAFDKFCWNSQMMMNVGDVKGKILDSAIESHILTQIQSGKKSFNVLELGSYCGYSTIRIAIILQRFHKSHGIKGTIFSVDPDSCGHAVAAKLIQVSGVGEYVSPIFDYSDKAIVSLAEKGVKIDAAFIDHVKHLYLPDLKLIVSSNLLNQGAVVIGDNILFPGAPDYKEYLVSGPGKEIFDTVVNPTFVEYSKTVRDEVLVSKLRKQ